MNLEHVQTEPYVRFREFRDNFDRSMRVTYGGLQLLRKQVDRDDDVAQTVELPTGDEPWGPPRHWRNIPHLTKHATLFLGHMGLVRVMSGFEDFLSNVNVEHQRFTALSADQPVPAVVEEPNGLRTLFARLELNTDVLSTLLPLFDYFTFTRNCIVHRDGRASRALIELAAGNSFRDAVARWNQDLARPLPVLPDLNLNHEIPLLPRHAVLASIVCNRIAHVINRKLVEILGEGGLINMAAWHTLLASEVRLTFVGRCGSPQKLLKRALRERYYAEDIEVDDLPRALRKIGKWSTYYRRFVASPYWPGRLKGHAQKDDRS